jgi:CheY-like chemotaxis protein
MSTKPIRILLIEDDPDDVDFFNMAINNFNLPVSLETISQGDRVLPHLETLNQLPQVIVLDLNLPKLHGKEVLQRIKDHPQFATIPVVILTTSSAEQDREFCLTTGAEHYLIKPVAMNEYESILNTITETASFQAGL